MVDRFEKSSDEDSRMRTKGEETKQYDSPKKTEHVAEEIDQIEYLREAAWEGEDHKRDDNLEY